MQCDPMHGRDRPAVLQAQLEKRCLLGGAGVVRAACACMPVAFLRYRAEGDMNGEHMYWITNAHAPG